MEGPILSAIPLSRSQGRALPDRYQRLTMPPCLRPALYHDGFAGDILLSDRFFIGCCCCNIKQSNPPPVARAGEVKENKNSVWYIARSLLAGGTAGATAKSVTGMDQRAIVSFTFLVIAAGHRSPPPLAFPISFFFLDWDGCVSPGSATGPGEDPAPGQLETLPGIQWDHAQLSVDSRQGGLPRLLQGTRGHVQL